MPGLESLAPVVAVLLIILLVSKSFSWSGEKANNCDVDVLRCL